MHPLIQRRLNKPRSLFSHGHRLRMNIVPMFLNVVVPWGVFVFCCGMRSFSLMYAHPTIVWGSLALVFLLWLVTVVVAFQARRRDPDPTWFTYFSVVFAIMAVAGAFVGTQNYERLFKRYYMITDLKIASGIDASVTPGQNVMDAGIIEFNRGNVFDPRLSWHFKHRSLYCVAPILTESTPPLHQTYDFWAVGQDCCAMGASDFRCGDWGSSDAKSGVRLMDDDAAGYYRLAVQQAESLYGISAPKPIFIEWATDPLAEVNGWSHEAFRWFCVQIGFAFVCSAFLLTLASVKYSWLGRAESVYQMEYYNDPEWMHGYMQQNMNDPAAMYY